MLLQKKKCVIYAKSDNAKGLSLLVSNNVNREGKQTECERKYEQTKLNLEFQETNGQANEQEPTSPKNTTLASWNS